MFLKQGFNYTWHDIDWFLEKNELKNAIYDDLIENTIISRLSFAEITSVFNDAYMNCIKIVNDKHPEIDFHVKFEINKCSEDKYPAWWIAYIILDYISSRTNARNIKRFLKCADSCYQIFNRDFDELRYSLEEEQSFLSDASINLYDFSIEYPKGPKGIDTWSWYCFTDEFQESSATQLLDCYNPEDRLRAVDLMEKAWDEYIANPQSILPF